MNNDHSPQPQSTDFDYYIFNVETRDYAPATIQQIVQKQQQYVNWLKGVPGNTHPITGNPRTIPPQRKTARKFDPDNMPPQQFCAQFPKVLGRHRYLALPKPTNTGHEHKQTPPDEIDFDL